MPKTHYLGSERGYYSACGRHAERTSANFAEVDCGTCTKVIHEAADGGQKWAAKIVREAVQDVEAGAENWLAGQGLPPDPIVVLEGEATELKAKLAHHD